MGSPARMNPRTIRKTSRHRPERVPLPMPAPFPALDTSWQGKPPQRASMRPHRSRTARVVSERMSSCIQTPGQWSERTQCSSVSISQKPTVSKPPARRRPRAKPPMPENRSSVLITRHGSDLAVERRAATGGDAGTEIGKGGESHRDTSTAAGISRTRRSAGNSEMSPPLESCGCTKPHFRQVDESAPSPRRIAA